MYVTIAVVDERKLQMFHRRMHGAAHGRRRENFQVSKESMFIKL
jgi:hypothetical protein